MNSCPPKTTTSKRNSDDDLDYALEDAWNSEQAKADEYQVEDDFLAGERDRAGVTDDQAFEIAYDASVIRKKTAQARAEAAAGGVADRPPTAITKKAAAERLFDAHLSGAWDAMAGTRARPAETKPEAAPPQQADGGLSPEDHAALAKMPDEARAVVEREYAANQQAMAPINALAERWSPTLASRGATTAADQVRHVDRVLETEHMLLNGTREQKIQVMQQLAHAAGLGAPTGGPVPQPHMQAHAPQMQPPYAPPATGDALVDQLQRSHHAQQVDAWREAMATAGPQGAQAQTVHRAREHVMAVATQRDQAGNLVRPYFQAVARDIGRAAQAEMRAGRTPDIAAIYDAAVAVNPNVQAHKLAAAKAQIRNFQSANPGALDPAIRKRMTSVATGHARVGRPIDLPTVFAEALRREKIPAAKYQRQIADAKAGGHKVEATIDQQLEAAYAAGVGI